MATIRIPVGLVLLAALAALVVSGGSGADSVQRRYLPNSNTLRTVRRFGAERTVAHTSLGRPHAIEWDRRWISHAVPLGPTAPAWARRMYRRSLLVLQALTDRHTGAVLAGAREGWEYVWPRDASAVALALASAGYRAEARRIVRFLLRLDLEAAARFQPNGAPVEGREAQGDAAGWIAVAAKRVGLRDSESPQPWRNRADYQEGDSGDYLGNALASTATDGPQAGLYVPFEAHRRQVLGIRREFGTADYQLLARDANDPGAGLDSAAAWAVRPFKLRSLYPAARRTLLRIVAGSGPFGIVPSENWDGGADPWTAPTAWTAWSLAALGERRAALRLMAALRRDATPAGLPERVDARTGIPTSTTPLAWSHAFAILTLRQLWP